MRIKKSFLGMNEKGIPLSVIAEIAKLDDAEVMQIIENGIK
jgi:hypothetical protein